MLLTTQEAMAVLRISKPTLLKNAERLGGFKVGNQWRFDSNKLGGEKDERKELERD